MLDKDRVDDSSGTPQIIETHISWIVLTDHYAYKIKRPVQYSFLDFSTLEKRKYFCEREIELNRRLAPDMYLGVVPITDEGIGTKKGGDVVDYAVQMKRMNNAFRMDKLLSRNDVSKQQLSSLAHTVAAFHKNARIIKDPFDTTGFQNRFADIGSVRNFIRKQVGDSVEHVVEKDFDNAVRTAVNIAEEGDIVLLAPACASFDQFNNYEERGRRFKELVNSANGFEE